MSLVVSAMSENGPVIVSDMRITLPDDQRPNFITNNLKAITISPHIAICYAGDVTIALDCIRNCSNKLKSGESTLSIKAILLETTKLENGVEFILAISHPHFEIMRIRNGICESNLQTAWIGDQIAFETFQKKKDWIERNEPQIPILAPYLKIHNLGCAMDAVIQDSAIETVGDFSIRISTKENKFQYLGLSFIYVGRDITIKNGDNLIDKMAHPIEEGGYAVCVVEPLEAGVPVIGLCFPRAKLGMLYAPLLQDEAFVIRDLSVQDFSKIIFKKFGIKMKEPGLFPAGAAF